MRDSSRHTGLGGALILVLAFVMTFSMPGQTQADGWTMPRGLGFYQVRFEMLRSRSYFEPTGNRITVPTVGSYRVSLYGEYGVTNRITVLAYVPFERLTLNRQVGVASGVELDPGDTFVGPADIVLGVRGNALRSGRTVVSVGLAIGVPTGNTKQESGLYTGDGEVNQQVTFEVGHGFGTSGYLVGVAGFNHRTRGFSDEVVYRLEVGGPVWKRLSGAIRVSGTEPLRNGDARLGGRGLRGNDQRFLRYGAELRMASSETIGITLSLDRNTLIENGLGGSTVGLSVFARL